MRFIQEVDDHGIDFVAKTKNGQFLEFQVKAIHKTNYTFMKKDKWNIDDPNMYLILLIFSDYKIPDVHMIPATSWKTPNALLCDKDYIGLKSAPEYGVNISKKNMPLLEAYKIEKTIKSIIES